MILYHAAYDLGYLGLAEVDLSEPFWFFEGHFVRFSFLLLVGISLVVSYKDKPNYPYYLGHHVRRALKLMLIALFITAATWFVEPSHTVLFGILHLISFGILLGALLVRSRFLPVLAALACFYLGFAFASTELPTASYLFLGIKPVGFSTFDYFPLFPWLGVVFLGISLAHELDRRGKLTQAENTRPPGLLSKIGQHALLIYLIHQPVLVAGLLIVSRFI